MQKQDAVYLPGSQSGTARGQGQSLEPPSL